jgi:hypothetical protein
VETLFDWLSSLAPVYVYLLLLLVIAAIIIGAWREADRPPRRWKPRSQSDPEKAQPAQDVQRSEEKHADRRTGNAIGGS